MKDKKESVRMRWARLRFSIIGPLLAAPPERGELQAELTRLAGKSYRHPSTAEAIRFGVSTLERWLYVARNHPDDPIGALARRLRKNVGTHPSLSVALEQALRAQYRRHPRWSYQLHHDNLVALAESEPELSPVPSYSTLSRFMKAHGLVRQRKRSGNKRGRLSDDQPFEVREVRSFEVEHVHALWHADFHEGSRRVLLEDGQWHTCHLLGVLDDRSRLCCHLQWYLWESAETFVHGLSQAILKRGLPRALLTDNGKALLAAEPTEGLTRLSVIHYTTLPYSPEQNAKQESFWGRAEGRLLPMLEAEPVLTLPLLNQATQAWVELEYHRSVHTELGDTPLHVAQTAANLGRPAPESQALRRAFRTQEVRTQRLSDGTISVCGVRFELPSRYRTLLRPTVRFARWDLSSISLVDSRSETFLCELYPLDKRRNADRRRRVVEPVAATSLEEPKVPPEPESGIAPLLQKLMAEYAATGLPPAYLPHRATSPSHEKENDS